MDRRGFLKLVGLGSFVPSVFLELGSSHRLVSECGEVELVNGCAEVIFQTSFSAIRGVSACLVEGDGSLIVSHEPTGCEFIGIGVSAGIIAYHVVGWEDICPRRKTS